jgi:hypothetical protein
VKSPLPSGCELPREPPRDEIEPLDAQLSRLHVTVSRRLLEKLDAAKDALAHACPGATAADVFERGLDLVLALHAKRKGLVEKPRKERTVSSFGADVERCTSVTARSAGAGGASHCTRGAR